MMHNDPERLSRAGARITDASGVMADDRPVAHVTESGRWPSTVARHRHPVRAA